MVVFSSSYFQSNVSNWVTIANFNGVHASATVFPTAETPDLLDEAKRRTGGWFPKILAEN